ncbi:hypothetical protein GE061_011787 [Apolygus lucorum]|uniref:lysozyme n=1 Tax=Apolygus lucorum TaxID=248454 RepID=A0A8S9Y150_APOLU|nr:hypothetical protein GE061_011787 [Apolygus lucorum]
MRRATSIFVLVLLVPNCVDSRILTACELAHELGKPELNVSLWQIPTWVCIARHATGFDTSYDDGLRYGIFGVWGSHWCKECNLPCHKPMDDDLTDYIRCVVHKVFPAHEHHRDNGFEAWGHHYSKCHKPWKDLADIPCNLHHNKIGSNTTHVEIHHNGDSDYHYEDYTHVVDFTEDPPDNSSWTESEGNHRTHHHILPTDAGLLIFVLLCVLLTGAVIEGFRRSGLQVFSMCAR